MAGVLFTASGDSGSLVFHRVSDNVYVPFGIHIGRVHEFAYSVFLCLESFAMVAEEQGRYIDFRLD